MIELNRHKPEILEKTKLSSEEFEEFIKRLQQIVNFVPFSQYSDKISQAFELLPKHPKDVDFLALALKLNTGIVSEDKELQKQSSVPIFDNSRISELI